MLDNDSLKIEFNRRDKILIGLAVAVLVAAILASVYYVLWLKAETFNARTGADVSPWEMLWMDTTYTGPRQ